MKRLILLLFLMLLVGCTPSITRIGYEDPGSMVIPDCEVIFKEGQSIGPGMGEVIGVIELDDSGFTTNCGEEEMLELLEQEACAIGANLVLLKEIRQPDLASSCYRVKADLIRLDEAIDLEKLSQDENLSEKAIEARKNDYSKQVLGYVLGFLLGYAITGLLF